MVILLVLPTLTFTVVAVALTSLYWYFRHRLSYWKKKGIPGPEPRFFIGNLYSQIPWAFQLKEWTKKHGRTYGIYEGVQRVLVTSDPDIVHEVLVNQFECFNDIKPPFYENPRIRDTIAQTVLGAKGREWWRLHHLTKNVFNDHALEKLFPIMENSAKVFLSKAERVLNMPLYKFPQLEICQELFVDVLSRLCTGQENSRPFHNGWSRELFNSSAERSERYAGTRARLAFPALEKYIWKWEETMTGWTYEALPFLQREIEKNVDRKIEERSQSSQEKEKKKCTDLVDILLETTLTREEIVGYCLMLFLTCAHSGSNMIACGNCYASQVPGFQDQLDKAVRDECSLEYSLQSRTARQVMGLKYMDNLFKETQRLMPVMPYLISRRCTESTTIGNGIEMTPGMCVQIDVLSLHTDPSIWGEDANEFKPERWDSMVNLHPSAFIPYGLGPRMDPTRRLTEFMLKLACAYTTSLFEVESTQEESNLRYFGGEIAYPIMSELKLKIRQYKDKEDLPPFAKVLEQKKKKSIRFAEDLPTIPMLGGELTIGSAV